jgi:hypothetical protein
MKKTLTAVFCSALLLGMGMFASESGAQLVQDADIVTTFWDCDFNEAAGTSVGTAAASCGALNGGQVWFNPQGNVTDGAGNVTMSAPGCGDPGGKYIRTHGLWATPPDQTNTTDIYVFETYHSYLAGGDVTDNNWPRGGLTVTSLSETTADYTHSLWNGNGVAAAWATAPGDQQVSFGNWVFTGEESTSTEWTDGTVGCLRMIYDTTTDGSKGATHMNMRLEQNPDVLGAGAWQELVPVGADFNNQIRQNGAAGPPGGDKLNVWLNNMDCDGITQLIDRARVYSVSAFIPVEVSGFSID